MDEQKLLKMYEMVNGEASGRFKYVVVYHENGYDPIGIDLIKDSNNNCGGSSVEEIMFDYLTREWD